MAYAFRSTLTRFALVLTLLALCSSLVWAQGGTGELSGLVTDPTGAVVANAQLTLTNSATGEKRATTTTPSGFYRFSSLPVVGTYTLQTAPKGFKSVKVAGIMVSVGSTVSQDLKLELGQASEQVTVEAGAETVQTTESSLSQLVDRRVWQQMPLQIRNQNSFIELVAGASPQDGSGTNRGAEVNGTRSGAGSYLVDGIDNNEQGQAGRGQISPYDKGGASTSISPDAIQEYRVITNSFSAEYGKGGGFITDTVLRGGTNQWHGSAFEYNRIQALAANDWFSSQVGIKDRLVRNQFGGSIGGPIIKDKTFFFGTAELHRVRQVAPFGPFTVTTSQFMNFVQTGGLENFAENDPNGICNNQPLLDAIRGPGVVTAAPCPGQFALASTIGPVASRLLANPANNFPVVNSSVNCASNPGPCTGRGIYTNGLTYPVPVYGSTTLNDPTDFNEARWSLKVDHNFSDRDKLSGVYLFQDGTQTEKYQGGFNFIGPGIIQDGRGQNLGVTWNHTFSPTLLNTFKVGYLRHKLNFPSPEGAFGTPGYYTLDGISEDFGQYPGLPQFFTENQFQYMDTMSLVKGKHSFKFGGEFRRTRNGSSFFNSQFSSVLPWGIEDTLTDLAFSDEADRKVFGGQYFGGSYYVSAAVVPSTGQQPVLYRGFRANEFAGFVQDDWRITNRLTLNLGLRWEYFGPPHNFEPGIDSNFYFGSNVTPIINTNTGMPCNDAAVGNPFCPAGNPFYASVHNGAFQIRDHEIWNKDTNNWGPRVGFAWDVFGSQKFVVRAGYGIMYDRIYNNLFENIRFNPPYFSVNQVFDAGAVSSPGLLTYPFTSTALFADPAFQPKPNPRHMDQNIVTPYYEQLHFGVQWEFAKGWVFEPEYVATWGHKLTGISDINTFDGRVSGAGTTARINTSVGSDNYRSNSFGSNYNALQLSVRKTYAAGLTLGANYTYAKAMDNLSDAFNNKAGTVPTDNMDIHLDHAAADFDLRHRFVATVSYDLPFMKQNRWLGGWGVNSIISWQTGHPFSPYSGSGGYDLNKDGKFTDRLVPSVAPMDSVLSGSAQSACDAALVANGNGGHCYFNIADWATIDPVLGPQPSYTCPATVNGGFWCNAPIGRNSIFGPHFANVDFNVSKKFKITEAMGLTFQANFFNLFNHPNFLPPGSSGTGANIQSSQFGASTAVGSR